METDALLFMLAAWGCVLSLLGYCVYKLIKNPQVVSILTGDDNESPDD